MKPLQHYWYHKNYWIWLLLPISWLYCFVIFIRRKLYQAKIKKSFASSLPIVIVGNITIGGSGKTPLLISLCEMIKQWGYNPGVVSRGYGGNYDGVHQVTNTDSAALVGDEPLMIHQRTQVPVVVCADRVTAVDYLVKNNDCDIVLSDDGLQHYRMRRDYEISVIEANRKFGNGFCLPAGPLREPVSRLDKVDLSVYNRTNDTTINDTESQQADNFSYTLVMASLVNLNNGEEKQFADFLGESVHAVAGIGNPQRFFTQLQQAGVKSTNHEFPDHHEYQKQDFSGWREECIIMTEKDAVKCRKLKLKNAWFVRVTVEFTKALENRLSADLLPLLKTNH